MPYIEFRETYQSREDNRTYKAGEIIEVDHDNFIELTSMGIAAAYIEPPEKIEETLIGERTIQFIKTTEEYKCGDMITIEANAAREFIKKGIAIYLTSAEEEEEKKNQTIKSIYKMNKEELLQFAEEKNIKIGVNWRHTALIKKIIEMELIIRGEN